MRYLNSLIAAVLFLFGMVLARSTSLFPADRAAAEGSAAPKAAVDDLPAQVKKLQELVPDQAAVMHHLSYHFTNLWFAVDQENWPLAEFYLGETRSNLKWAVRAKPLRKDPSGKETVDLAKIAEATDNGPLTQLKKAIAAKDKKTSVKLYHDMLSACYACHKASYKPYLRPQVPTSPEVRVINFDPKATTPQQQAVMRELTGTRLAGAKGRVREKVYRDFVVRRLKRHVRLTHPKTGRIIMGLTSGKATVGDEIDVEEFVGTIYELVVEGSRTCAATRVGRVRSLGLAETNEKISDEASG